MDFIFRLAEEFLKKHRSLNRYRRVFALIAAVVVFATTYELILPAITMDRRRAAETPGVEVGVAAEGFEEEAVESESFEEGADLPSPDAVSSDEFEDSNAGSAGSGQDKSPGEAGAAEEDKISGDASGAASSHDNSGDSSIDADTDVATGTEGSNSGDGSVEAESFGDSDSGSGENGSADGSDAAGTAGDQGLIDGTGENAGVDAGENGTAVDPADTAIPAETTDPALLTPGETIVTYPATIIFEGKDYTITATFDEAAGLPADVRLDAVEILPDVIYKDENGNPLYPGYEEYYEKAVQALEKEKKLEDQGQAVTTARFFDITFLDNNGLPVEPLAPVSIAVQYKDALSAADTADTMAVHFDADEKKSTVEEPAVKVTDVIETKKKVKKEKISEISFDTDKFSVYGVIGTRVVEKTVLASDGKNYKITVTCGADAGIPEGAALEVTEITAENGNYGEYVAKTEQVLGWTEGGTSFIRLFDIRIVDRDGHKVGISAPVDVEIRLDDQQESTKTQVVHFADEAADETIDDGTVVGGVKIEGDCVSFAAESFSVYAVTQPRLTVDYLTADGRTLKVTVEFDKDEQLPADAVLEVSELLREDDEIEWARRFQSLANVLYSEYGDVMMDDSRFLSIRIRSGEGEYRPALPVQVRINYVEAVKESDDRMLAVHYHPDSDYDAFEDADVIETTDTLDEAGTEIIESVFETTGFSDYDLVAISDHEENQPGNVDGTSTEENLKEKTAGTGTDTGLIKEVSDGKTLTEKLLPEKAPVLKAAGGTRNAGDVPDHAKHITDNHDGTYTLDLSVTGDADTTVEEAGNVNVLIIYDRSNSMTSRAGNSRYTRADQAEDVVYDFVNNLFNKQSQTNPANIQASLVTFARTGTVAENWTSTRGNISRHFDDGGTDGRTNLSYTGTASYGTNWESALSSAQTLLNQADDDPTFVIFVTDGAPTASGNGNNAISPNGASLNQLRPFYQAARTGARSIQNRANTTLYGIYAYGTEADLLDDLIYYSNTGSDRPGYSAATVPTDNYFNASETDALTQAIDSIFGQIVQAMGITAVEISDGTTHQVTTTSGEISDMLEVDESTYKYWISIPYVNNRFTRVDVVSGETVTYTLRDNGNGTVTVSWGSNSVTLTGTMSSGIFKYQWTEANALYNYNPPAAHMTGGTVDWNLSSVGTLLDGVTYTVSFECYPSQYTLDLIADLKNNPSSYNELDQNIRTYLLQSGDDYTLCTNTEAKLTYTDTRTGEGPRSVDYVNPDPVETATTEMVMLTKNWSNSIDDKDKPESLQMFVTRDGETKYELVLNNGNSWRDDAYISFGIMTIHEGNITIKAEGHDFTFIEPPDLQYHWELDAPVLRPMLINTVPTMLVRVEADEAPSGMSGANATAVKGGVTYYKLTIGGTTEYYKVDHEGASSQLYATNQRRSYLDVEKVVTGGESLSEDRFAFTMTVKNSHDTDEASVAEDLDSDYWVWFSVQDGDEQLVIDENLVSGTDVYRATEDGAYTGYYYMKSGSTVTVQMQKDYNLRFINLPTESTYTITEGAMPNDSYSFVSINSTVSINGGAEEAAEEGSGQTVSGTIENADSAYKVTATNHYTAVGLELKKVDDDGEPLGGAVFNLSAYVNGEPGGSGAWSVIQENITPGGILPAEDPSDPGAGSSSEGSQEGSSGAGTPSEGSQEGSSGSGAEEEPGTGSSGQTGTETPATAANPLDLGSLPAGWYKLTEEHTPNGYITTEENVYFEVYKEGGDLRIRLTDQNKAVIQSLPGVTFDLISTGDPVKYRITVENAAGEELPLTGGSGSRPYALGGIILTMASALMFVFKMRRGERRLQ